MTIERKAPTYGLAINSEPNANSRCSGDFESYVSFEEEEVLGEEPGKDALHFFKRVSVFNFKRLTIKEQAIIAERCFPFLLIREKAMFRNLSMPLLYLLPSHRPQSRFEPEGSV